MEEPCLLPLGQAHGAQRERSQKDPLARRSASRLPLGSSIEVPKFVPIKGLTLVQIDVLFKPTKTKEPVAMAPQTIQTLESTCAKPSTSSKVKPEHHQDTRDQHQPARYKIRMQREAGKITHRRRHENYGKIGEAGLPRNSTASLMTLLEHLTDPRSRYTTRMKDRKVAKYHWLLRVLGEHKI